MTEENPADRTGDDATDGVSGPTTEPEGSGDTAADIAVLLALVVFAISLLAVPVAVVVGADVAPAVASNAAAAVAIVSWTSRRSFRDPTSSVSTVPGALGTALVFLGIYGLLLAGGLWLSAPFHGRGDLVWPVGVAGGVGTVLGLVTFAFEAVFTPAGSETNKPREGERTTGDERE